MDGKQPQNVWFERHPDGLIKTLSYEIPDDHGHGVSHVNLNKEHAQSQFEEFRMQGIKMHERGGSCA